MYRVKSKTKVAAFTTMLAAFSFGLTASNVQAADKVSKPASTKLQSTVVRTSINLENMDKSVSPCQDFFQYANGTWLKNTPIPGDYSSWGIIQITQEKTYSVLRRILEDAAGHHPASGSKEQKIGDFWASGMDEEKIEREGIKPLQAELDRIESMKTMPDVQAEITRLQQFNITVPFSYRSGQDYKNSEVVIAQAEQDGLGLPDRDYYLSDDDKFKKIRQQYFEHLTKVFALLGRDQATASHAAEDVLALETRLAQASMKKTDMRVPQNVYHKMTVQQFNSLMPHFDWTKFNSDIGFANINEINVGEPGFFSALDAELAVRTAPDWRNYLTYHLVNSMSPYLSSQFVDEEFDFNGRILQGKQKNLPRWKRVVIRANAMIGQLVGQLYVQEVFPPEAKARALHMVLNMKSVLHDELEKNDWMSPETKKNALAKLDAFSQKIGYPDKWRDYSKLEITRDSYLTNGLRCRQFEFERWLSKIGKPVDRTDWLMSPQAINAYYEPEKNEIVFPAGFLQTPFFDAKADDAANYGGIGSVIGHEITHGFDDEGSKFDGQGNLKDWWTADDKKRFEERIDLIVKQFDDYVVGGDTHMKGKLVSGEAAADLGGAIITYKAFEYTLKDKDHVVGADGFTPEQRFFIAFGQLFCQNNRPETERLQANTNPHPINRFRVNGTVANMDAFAKAFGVDAKCPMMLPPDKRCRLW